MGSLRTDSGDDLADRLAVVDLEPFAAGDLELARVEAELVQDRGVDVGHVVAIFDGVEADLVGRAVDDAPLDAAAGQPGAEALRVVVAAVGLGRPANGRTRCPRRRSSRRACRAACRSLSKPAIGRSTCSESWL